MGPPIIIGCPGGYAHQSEAKGSTQLKKYAQSGARQVGASWQTGNGESSKRALRIRLLVSAGLWLPVALRRVSLRRVSTLRRVPLWGVPLRGVPLLRRIPLLLHWLHRITLRSHTTF
jgi:hypothetical protein